METFKNINGETVYNVLYAKGIMKQIGQLDAEIGSKGYELFLHEIIPAYQLHSELNHSQISQYGLIADIFGAGYLAGIRAERAKKKRK